MFLQTIRSIICMCNFAGGEDILMCCVKATGDGYKIIICATSINMLLFSVSQVK